MSNLITKGPVRIGYVYTPELLIDDYVLTPIGIGKVKRRISLMFITPGRFRLFLEFYNNGGFETIKLITTQHSNWLLIKPKESW